MLLLCLFPFSMIVEKYDKFFVLQKASSLLFDNIPGNQLLHDLVGAPVDGLDPASGVALGYLRLPHEAPAPVKLKAVGRNLVL